MILKIVASKPLFENMNIITLSSNIQEIDFIVGALKGQVLSTIPNTMVVDLNHNLPSQNDKLVIYLIQNAIKYYPPKTIHILYYNLYEHVPKRMLIFNYLDNFIVCPDNGFVAMFHNNIEFSVYEINIEKSDSILEINQKLLSQLQIFVQNFNVAVFNTCLDFQIKYALQNSKYQNSIEVVVIFVDFFENVVLNITKKEFLSFTEGKKFKIIIPGAYKSYITEIKPNYSFGKDSECMAWFNSAGYLELALKNENIAGLFGLNYYENGTRNQYYNKVSIVLED